jgi:MFS family permease
LIEQVPRVEQTVGAEIGDELREGAGKLASLSVREQVGLSFHWFSLNFLFAALLPIVIPAQIVLFVAPGSVGNIKQATFLGVLAAVGAVTALIVQPIVGLLSDRTTSRFGRRRPYIVGGGVLLLGGLALLATSPGKVLFLLGLMLVTIAHTTSSAAYQGLVPDRVPAHQRGAASGYTGLMTILGTVGSLAVAALLLGQATGSGPAAAGHVLAAGIALGAAHFYLIAAIVLAVGIVVTMIAVREVPIARHQLQQFRENHAVACSMGRLARLRETSTRLWITPWRHANFTWVFLTRGFVMLGLALFMTFIEYYFKQVAHATNFVQATALNAVLALVGAVASTLLVGIFTDRTRRRVPVVLVASALMAVTALAFVLVPGKIPLWPLGITFGLGYGAYTSVDWALAVDALPTPHQAGKDMGLWSIASTLPAILAPLVGTAILTTFTPLVGAALGYRLVFGVAAFCLVLGAVFVLKVREAAQHVAPAYATTRPVPLRQ